jgi:hypothetical protein
MADDDWTALLKQTGLVVTASSFAAVLEHDGDESTGSAYSRIL